MHCYACANEAVEQCPRCANSFCDNHGSGLCARCEDPALTTPSANVFRFALLGLVFASVLALWLIVRPPDLPEGSSSIVQPLPTEQVDSEPSAIGPTPTSPPVETSAPSDGVSPTPETGETPAPTPEATEEPGPLQYVVEPGDTWYGIADAFGIDADVLVAQNGRTLDDILNAGETIVIPQ